MATQGEKALFMGAAEIARRLGVGRERAKQLVRDRTFPEPYQRLAMGQIWAADDVEAWIRKHRPHLVDPGED